MDILVVDDTPDVADIVAQMLALQGHRARIATTLDEASREIVERRYDACIVDLGIKDEEERLPELLRARGVRAISCTAREDLWRGSRRAALYEFFFTKPSSFDIILAAVEGRECPACRKPISLAANHADCTWRRR